jgi:hypothetical protein
MIIIHCFVQIYLRSEWGNKNKDFRNFLVLVVPFSLTQYKAYYSFHDPAPLVD